MCTGTNEGEVHESHDKMSPKSFLSMWNETEKAQVARKMRGRREMMSRERKETKDIL